MGFQVIVGMPTCHWLLPAVLEGLAEKQLFLSLLHFFTFTHRK